MRVQFFYREQADGAGFAELQTSVNAWLRKLDRKGFRVVNQEVRMSRVADPANGDLDDYPAVVIAIWYEKETKEVP